MWWQLTADVITHVFVANPYNLRLRDHLLFLDQLLLYLCLVYSRCTTFMQASTVIVLFGVDIRRVDEFKECGDMDMMMQYVKDVQNVQKKLTECVDSIGFINEVTW